MCESVCSRKCKDSCVRVCVCTRVPRNMRVNVCTLMCVGVHTSALYEEKVGR